MVERIKIAADGALLAELVRYLPGWKRTTLKERLHAGRIQVNGRIARRHDHPLAAGDLVTIDAGSASGDVDAAATAPGTAEAAPRELAGLRVLYLDDRLVAIDKPAGLLSVSTDRQKARTALALVRDALSRPGRAQSLWPVHRLDRETSGVLLLARDRDACDSVRAQWESSRKIYAAIVEGHPEPPQGKIDQPLYEDQNLRVRVGRSPGAKDARTHYATRTRGREQTLLDVTLETGRRHQIRVHLAWLGHPIVGDDRYGTGGARLMLHARRLTIPALDGRRELEFEAAPPREFVPAR